MIASRISILAAASAAALPILAPAPSAQQPYRAAIAFEIGAGSGFRQKGPTQMSAAIASTSGRCFGGPPGCNDPSYDETAGAASSPDVLRGHARGWSALGITATGLGRAWYRFEDVRFADSANPGVATPITVRMPFLVAGSQGNAAAPHAFVKLAVSFEALPPYGGIWSWNADYQPDGGVPIAVQTAALPLQTEITYALEIVASFQAWGNQGYWNAIEGTVVWDDPSFVLAPGITVTSAEAGILGNARTYASPAIVPLVTTSFPVTAGGSMTLAFGQGKAGSPARTSSVCRRRARACRSRRGSRSDCRLRHSSPCRSSPMGTARTASR